MWHIYHILVKKNGKVYNSLEKKSNNNTKKKRSFHDYSLPIYYIYTVNGIEFDLKTWMRVRLF